MSKPKPPQRPKLTVVGSKPARKPLNASDIMDRLSDCQGAVALAIKGILEGDEVEIGSAVGSLCIVERELQNLRNQIDLDEIAARAGEVANG